MGPPPGMLEEAQLVCQLAQRDERVKHGLGLVHNELAMVPRVINVNAAGGLQNRELDGITSLQGKHVHQHTLITVPAAHGKGYLT